MILFSENITSELDHLSRVDMIIEERRKAAEVEYREKLNSIDRASDERPYSMRSSITVTEVT